jgi:hypothetical protein
LLQASLLNRKVRLIVHVACQDRIRAHVVREHDESTRGRDDGDQDPIALILVSAVVG